MAIDDSDHHSTITITITITAVTAILLATTAAAQPTSGVGSDPTDPYPYNPKFNPSMSIIIIILVIALFFMGFFSIYLRHCTENSPNSFSNLMITTARSRRSGVHQRGLDPELIASFPTFVYEDVKILKVGNGALECAVCLNEFEGDETLSLIPNCDHVFHPDCIGAWLSEHVTCPVCRADLTKIESAAAAGEDVREMIGQSVQLNVDSTDITNSDVGENESMEMPLRSAEVVELGQRMNRNRTRRIQSGRPRFYGRMNSTGHVAVKQWENLDRFTLRLPVDVRKQVMSGKLTRSTSCVVLGRGSGSPRRGVNRAAGPGREGSVRGGGWSDRWSGFLSRWNSMRSIRGGGGWSMRSRDDCVHSLRGDVAMGSAVDQVRPPV